VNNTDAITNVSVLMNQWQSYWVIPVGMLVLYFYGRVHFNTPSYPLIQQDENGRPLSDPGRLLSLAPPLFTTTRSRFNRYAWRYILLLEVVFLILLFLPSVISDAGRILDLKLPLIPSSESLQYRTLFALFLLTGLLSSFPLLKDLDGHILQKLHSAAYIPEDATRLAEVLREARFVANGPTREEVQTGLTKRDLIAVSRGESTGKLEVVLLKTMWLKSEFLRLTTQEECISYRLALARDISDVAASWANLKPTLMDYFVTQEKIIATAVADIDAEFAKHSSQSQFADLSGRREQLTGHCVALFQRLCLLMALLVYGTKTTPDEIDETIRNVGFQIEVSATPIWDWNTIARVVVSVFATLVASNVILLYAIFLWKIDSAWALSLTRRTMLLDSFVDTVPFAFTLLIAIRRKRAYRLHPKKPARPENLLVAAFSFLTSAIYYLLVELALGSGINTVPLLLAFTPGVAAYFSGVYIDRSLRHYNLSWSLVCWQSVLQGLGTGMAIFFASSFEDPMQIGYVVAYAAFQSAAVGFLMGYLFQRFYQRSEFLSGSTFADIAYRPISKG
jgi:hypothetical protein